MREKCPYLEFFWSVYSPDAGKYGHFSRIANIYLIHFITKFHFFSPHNVRKLFSNDFNG